MIKHHQSGTFVLKDGTVSLYIEVDTEERLLSNNSTPT